MRTSLCITVGGLLQMLATKLGAAARQFTMKIQHIDLGNIAPKTLPRLAGMSASFRRQRQHCSNAPTLMLISGGEHARVRYQSRKL
jgi:hypothetical protein